MPLGKTSEGCEYFFRMRPFTLACHMVNPQHNDTTLACFDRTYTVLIFPRRSTSQCSPLAGRLGLPDGCVSRSNLNCADAGTEMYLLTRWLYPGRYPFTRPLVYSTGVIGWQSLAPILRGVDPCAGTSQTRTMYVAGHAFLWTVTHVIFVITAFLRSSGKICFQWSLIVPALPWSLSCYVSKTIRQYASAN